jgi:hypothetical protein
VSRLKKSAGYNSALFPKRIHEYECDYTPVGAICQGALWSDSAQIRLTNLSHRIEAR